MPIDVSRPVGAMTERLSSGFIVAQLGARMHYAVPRILWNAGMLERLYTDISAVNGWPRLLQLLPRPLLPPPVRRLAERVPNGVPAARVTAFTSFGVEYARRRSSATSASAAHLWAGRTFCEMIVRRGLGNAAGVYAFNTAGLELLEYARRGGLHTVVEQTIAPAALEDRLLLEEYDRFPEWASSHIADPDRPRLADRETAEWASADAILCPSAFVRDGIAACGGPADRCVIVPYGVDLPASPLPERSPKSRPLRVLSVGAVGLRKGAPYILEAATKLSGRAEFRWIGPISVPPQALNRLRSVADVPGPVPRSQIWRHYQWADVFFLPSVCEGSATVCYEALAAGLPVITTPNAGSVVRHSIDGYIVPVRDPAAMATAIESLCLHPELRAEMSRNALERARQFTLAAYAGRLLAALDPERLAAVHHLSIPAAP